MEDLGLATEDQVILAWLQAEIESVGFQRYLAGEPANDLPRFPLDGLRMAVPQTMVLEGVEPAVARAFDAALAALRNAGARIVDIPLRELAELAQINAKGGLAAAQTMFQRIIIAWSSCIMAVKFDRQPARSR